jgi:S-adenosylmethionine synthetase
MPLPIDLSHALLRELANIRKNESDLMPYLRPDAKSQVTIEYAEDGTPLRIDTIVISTQHDEFILPINKSADAVEKANKAMQERIKHDVMTILVPRVREKYKYREEIYRLFDDTIRCFVNPTGKFVLGGPHADTGLTGRKIIVDTYGGKVPHGGGAFSGKDPSKVDRSATYEVRHIAKNLVAAGVSPEVLIQISYAIGIAEPMSIYVNTYGKSNVKMSDAEIAKKIGEMFDMRPKAIEQRLKLRNPIYFETASYGHFGREPRPVKKVFSSRYMPEPIELEVELFTWEKLDYVDQIKEAFGL